MQTNEREVGGAGRSVWGEAGWGGGETEGAIRKPLRAEAGETKVIAAR